MRLPGTCAGIVRHPKVGAAGNHVTPQGLVADQCQERRVVNSAPSLAALLDPLAPLPVAAGAGPRKDAFPDLLVLRRASTGLIRRDVQGRSAVREPTGRSPLRSGPVDVPRDLDLA